MVLCSTNVYGQETSDEELADSLVLKTLKERYLEKISQFGEFISFIADTRHDRKTRLYHCKNALNLFQERGEKYVTSDGVVNQGIKITIIRDNGQKRSMPLNSYLTGLANLKYNEVRIVSVLFPTIMSSSLKHVSGNKYEVALNYNKLLSVLKDGTITEREVTGSQTIGYIYKEYVEVIKKGHPNYEYNLPLGDIVAEEIQ